MQALAMVKCTSPLQTAGDLRRTKLHQGPDRQSAHHVPSAVHHTMTLSTVPYPPRHRECLITRGAHPRTPLPVQLHPQTRAEPGSRLDRRARRPRHAPRNPKTDEKIRRATRRYPRLTRRRALVREPEHRPALERGEENDGRELRAGLGLRGVVKRPWRWTRGEEPLTGTGRGTCGRRSRLGFLIGSRAGTTVGSLLARRTPWGWCDKATSCVSQGVRNEQRRGTRPPPPFFLSQNGRSLSQSRADGADTKEHEQDQHVVFLCVHMYHYPGALHTALIDPSKVVNTLTCAPSRCQTPPGTSGTSAVPRPYRSRSDARVLAQLSLSLSLFPARGHGVPSHSRGSRWFR